MKKSLMAIAGMLMAALYTGCTPPSTARPESFDSDEQMLDYIQRVHLNYMWDGAEPRSGMATERIHPGGNPMDDDHVVTTGGTGFGVAGLIVGIERGFIPRKQGVKRLHRIVDFLASAERFHGVWPHWIDSRTGKAVAFTPMDNGADLVESAFMIQGLICAREYFKDGNESERSLAAKIDSLWKGMEWSFFQRGGKEKLYWHWSPDYEWEMNFPLEGYNECLITYILGASSPTYPIDTAVYHRCWARNGAIQSDAAPYGYKLKLRHNGAEECGGPLFWAHYSYIGFCPKGTSDRYADYWDVVCNHALSDYAYCVDNPGGFEGYGPDCWGLTASYSRLGYAGHAPNNDLGEITPTAALSSFPYTPEESMRALKYFYFKMGEKLWGPYGFFDAFGEQEGWVSDGYLAIDQCTIAPMIENYRTGLLWRLFMGAPEIREGLRRLDFKTRTNALGE